MANSINNLKKELYDYALKTQKEYNSNKNVSKYKIKYLIVANIYKRVLSLNDEKSIIEYANELLSNSNECKKRYDELYKKYQSEKNNEEKQKIVKELNEYAFRMNAYNESYNIINKYMNKETTLNNDDTLVSDKIISLLEKYNELDQNTTEAKRIYEEIYKLRVERENKFKELYGENYRVYVSDIESIENMASVSPKERFIARDINGDTLLLELRDTINAINEYYFINELQIKKYYKHNNNVSDGKNNSTFLKKYNSYLRKYHILISSLFKSRSIDFIVDGTTISSDDLISYLATCNLDGDFNVYKSKFLETRIGTEETNKKKYIETLMFLNKCINELCRIVKTKASTKTIKIIDRELIQKDIIKLRNDKLEEIYFNSKMGKSSIRGRKL